MTDEPVTSAVAEIEREAVFATRRSTSGSLESLTRLGDDFVPDDEVLRRFLEGVVGAAAKTAGRGRSSSSSSSSGRAARSRSSEKRVQPSSARD
jgi:hypothetical protein